MTAVCDVVGSLRPAFPHDAFSVESARLSSEMIPRRSDVFIATPPKTGTTWLQHSLHCLRVGCAATGGAAPPPSFIHTAFTSRVDYAAWVQWWATPDSRRPVDSAAADSATGERALETSETVQASSLPWAERAMDYADLYQVAPWDQLAWDIGIDLNAEQPCNPRLFKSHLRLAHLTPGGKYIVTIRDPKPTIVSWYNFLRGKDVPPLRKYWQEGGGGVSAFAFDKDFVTEDMCFGATLWEYYKEAAACLADPAVLVIIYEDMLEDFEAQLRLIAAFLELTPSDDVIATVCAMSTKQFMTLPEHAGKFDETWSYRRMIELGRIADAQSFSIPTSRVMLTPHKDKLDARAMAHLDTLWAAELGAMHADFSALCSDVRTEHRRRRGAGAT
eukprot:m.294919 g.294919  ORF g.294919 m.294919 type:complete len:388 (+) comp27167_c2_seq10:4801-5964(+)